MNASVKFNAIYYLNISNVVLANGGSLYVKSFTDTAQQQISNYLTKLVKRQLVLGENSTCNILWLENTTSKDYFKVFNYEKLPVMVPITIMNYTHCILTISIYDKESSRKNVQKFLKNLNQYFRDNEILVDKTKSTYTLTDNTLKTHLIWIDGEHYQIINRNFNENQIKPKLKNKSTSE